MRVSAIIAAAGSGTRLGADIPKALVELAGEPLIVHAVRSMSDAGINDVVVTAPADHLTQFSQILGRIKVSTGCQVQAVVGGATRQASVACGLAAISSNADAVLVHDAARALTPVALIKRVVAALEAGHAAVVPGLPVVDTIKEIRSEPVAQSPVKQLMPEHTAVNQVMRTVDRSTLRAVQTPQGFTVDLLRRAHEFGEQLSTDEALAAPDDAALFEMLGEPVVIVEGASEAMKVTTAFDLAVAEIIARQE
ncbi:MAG: 2-C-methyl-D-erythritol 4-phosphate cytidylyltransferase [Actinomycetaceae bacterium]|nr:2-C-methyl-D-erythritol 4-phosphate cytidylyltransferase [Actinomycetaceae bacterium]